MAMALTRGTTNYAYAVARVQAKRSKLIPTSEFEKVLKMDVPEITRYIQDSAYKAEVDELAAKFSGLGYRQLYICCCRVFGRVASRSKSG